MGEVMNEVYASANSWAYDTSIAIGIAAVWWLAELCSALSQRRLQWIWDFNVAWTLLSILLVLGGAFAFVGEHLVRGSHGVSIPTTIATVVAASLSYVLVPERLSFFDRKARLIQKLLRTDKLRFGRPGRLGKEKYIIQWHWWRKGDPTNTWKECASFSERRGDQILLDWGVKQRLGDCPHAEVMNSIRGDDELFWTLVGQLLYAWLPTGAHAHIQPHIYFTERGRIRGGYGGVRGRRLRCSPEEVPFDDWLANPDVRQFQLAAVEYQPATKALIEMLPDIAARADSAENLASILMTEWSYLIDQKNPNLRP